MHFTKAKKNADNNEQYTTFTNQEINTLTHTCQTIVCNYIWTKTFNNSSFDISMGFFHGVEVCDLIGLYILNEISLVIGLYRDYGLDIMKQSSDLT